MAIAIWVFLAGFYLFLGGSFNADEAVACVLCATAGTTLACGLFLVSHRRFRGRPPIGAIARPFAALLPETFIVARELVAAILSRVDQRGVFVRQPFEPGTGEGLSTAGGRAWAVFGISLAPRTFVVRGETTDTILLHALPDRSASPDHRWPM